MLEQTAIKAGGSMLAELLDSALKKGLACLPSPYALVGYSAAFGDSDLIATCFKLFENDLNVSATAKALYMHRNTLIYRIAKIKRITGLDVTSFADAVTFLIMYRCFVEDKGGNYERK